MKIRSIKPGLGLFVNEEPVRFTPGINIIRGPNGIGKTLILEYASLLGHISVMQMVAVTGRPNVTLNVSLSPSERAFLKRLSAADREEPALKRFDEALATIECSLDQLVQARIPDGEFPLTFCYGPLAPNDDLKEILALERRIRSEVTIDGKLAQVRLAQALNLWSRPIVCDGRTPEEDVWSITPRYERSLVRGAKGPQPAPVFYVNTDMYEFGTGLDVRESPKHLKAKFTPIMVDRLQLVSRPRAPGPGRNLSTAFRESDNEQYLLCEKALRTSWNAIFGEYHQFESGSVTFAARERDDEAATNALSWRFQIGQEDSASFISSGENQAIFVLAMMHGLVTEGSCILLDEPELHLTFRAGSLLMERVLQRATETQSQAIIVTHMPHLYRDAVDDHTGAWKKKDFDYASIRMIHIGRRGDAVPRIVYDEDAVNRASRFAHADVISIVDGLHIKEVSIWPPASEWRSWLRLHRRSEKTEPAEPQQTKK